MKKILISLLFLLFLFAEISAQNMKVYGTIADTTNFGLFNASIIAIRLSDSVLTAYTRSNDQGQFNLTTAIDTCRIIISHPRFADKEYLLVGSQSNNDFNLFKISLPNKTLQLKEVTVFAYKEPVYFKGDTLVYTADSFKVKPNAVVEDLLKKLPGIEVAKDGSIKAQGKKIDKVLVDGDEFFGDDATIATKNLAADGVVSIQVYDKVVEGSDDAQKIMDLKLKEGAKKGYFGKLSGGTDMQSFYEGTALFNKFKNKESISFYASAINTPNQGLNWNDSYKYGIESDGVTTVNDGDNMYTYYQGNQKSGIPKNFAGAINYKNKINSKLKITSNISAKKTNLIELKNSYQQNLFGDTTFFQENKGNNVNKANIFNINTNIEYHYDSSLSFSIAPKFSFNNSQNISIDSTFFINEMLENIRKTKISNKKNAINLNTEIRTEFNKSFKNIKRTLSGYYEFENTKSDGDGNLLTSETNAIANNILSNIDQQKINEANNFNHTAQLKYVEPFTNKWRMELSVNNSLSNNYSNRETFNLLNGEYQLKDSLLSNEFINKRRTTSINTDLVYQVKKYTIRIGNVARQIALNNFNISNDLKEKQTNNFLLPKVRARYKLGDAGNLEFSYQTKSQAPSNNQLQPLVDNTNPNNVLIGNALLRPSYEHKLNFGINKFSMIKNTYYNLNLNYSINNNNIILSQDFDESGRNFNQYINSPTTTSYSISGYGSFPIYKNKLKSNIYGSTSYDNNISFINKVQYNNNNFSANGNVGLTYEITEDIEFGANASIDYTKPSSNISSNFTQPFTNQSFSAQISSKWPKKFIINADGNYTIYGQRPAGFNPNVFILNGSIERMFLKTENLIIGIKAFDILNQNTNISRTTNNNQIVDNRVKIITQFFLLTATLKFNNNKTKYDENAFD